MEPLSAHSSTPAVLRPAHALQSDLAAVLREGKVVAGEVLQTMDGGSVLIGIGRHRVPAQSGAQFTVGQELQLLVEAGEGGKPQLRILGPEGAEPKGLLAALRGLAGPPRSAASGLTDLSALLRTPEGAVQGGSELPAAGVAKRLLAALGRVLGNEGEGGPALRARTAAVGRGLEPSLLERALGELPRDSKGGLARAELESFRRLLFGAVRRGASTASSGTADPRTPSTRPGEGRGPTVGVPVERVAPRGASASGLASSSTGGPASGGGHPTGKSGTGAEPIHRAPLAELRRGIEAWFARQGLPSKGEGSAPPVPGKVPGELFLDRAGLDSMVRGLPALLRGALRETADSAQGERLLARLPHALAASGGRGVRALLVQALVEQAGVKFGWPTPAAPGPASSAAGIELTSMKVELLSALGILPEGKLRSAVERALHGIESEQLLNQARREAGEPTHWTIPVSDGPDWREAHLFHEERSKGEERGEAGESHRVTLALKLSGTGPLRADLWMGQGRVALRLRAEDGRVAEALGARLAELKSAVEELGWPLNARVEVGEPEEIRVGDRALNIAYLRDRRLLDMKG